MTLPDAPGDAPDDAAHWYCLRARPRQEAVAARALRRLDPPVGEVFCPRVRFPRPRRARAGYGGDAGWAWATEAMFPGYLFARFDVARRGREVHHARGVAGVVGFGHRPQPVPAAVLAALRAGVADLGEGTGDAAGEEADPALATVTVAPAPAPGQEVVLVDGALGGLRAVVTHYLPARQRVRVLLEFLGREMETELPSHRVLAPFAHPLRR